MKEIRILILEDFAGDAELNVRELRRANLTFVSQWVDTKEAFLTAMTEFEPDVILSNYSLPNFSGLEALRLCKKSNLDIPFRGGKKCWRTRRQSHAPDARLFAQTGFVDESAESQQNCRWYG